MILLFIKSMIPSKYEFKTAINDPLQALKELLN